MVAARREYKTTETSDQTARGVRKRIKEKINAKNASAENIIVSASIALPRRDCDHEEAAYAEATYTSGSTPTNKARRAPDALQKIFHPPLKEKANTERSRKNAKIAILPD